MELNLRLASDYARAIDALLDKEDAHVQQSAVLFINTHVVPKLDALTQDEALAKRRYVTLVAPADETIKTRVIDLLVCSGFQVRKSHDGGGMYETLVIVVPEEDEYD